MNFMRKIYKQTIKFFICFFHLFGFFHQCIFFSMPRKEKVKQLTVLQLKMNKPTKINLCWNAVTALSCWKYPIAKYSEVLTLLLTEQSFFGNKVLNENEKSFLNCSKLGVRRSWSSSKEYNYYSNNTKNFLLMQSKRIHSHQLRQSAENIQTTKNESVED